VRVLDFGRYIAGPYCAALLGDLGAEVIRIERPTGSEDRFIAPVTPDGDGALFLQCNRGKLGLTLEPTSPSGREVTRRLVRTADVVVANVTPASLTAMGLDYPSLVAERADVILTMVTAFGTEGPYADRVGFDGVGQAMSGAMYLSGVPDAPAKSIVNSVDFTTAISAALGTVAALLERGKTGRGRVVEASLLGSALTLMGPMLIEQDLLGIDRVGTGNRSQTSGPSDTFRTKDGFVLVQIVGQPIFERWAKLMGEPAWLTDPRYRDDLSRGKHGEALSDRMQAWCDARTTAEALAALDSARIPAGPVYSPRQTLEDPHVRAAGYFREMPHAGAPRGVRVPNAPVSLAGHEAPALRAPTLGEHTVRLLGELGFSAADVVELRRNGVV
jgi:crotonobetainyl-CoA:carnitine CoA-transferase CaiB-like acyl-CoA transferase